MYRVTWCQPGHENIFVLLSMTENLHTKRKYITSELFCYVFPLTLVTLNLNKYTLPQII